MIDERYIIEGDSNLTDYTLITEYFLNEQWLEVHRESFDINTLSGLPPYKVMNLGECEESEITTDADGKYRKVLYPKAKVNDGIWIKNNDKRMGLANFETTTEQKPDPIYENLAETRFFIRDEFGEIIGCPELTESLNRMNDDMMYFNLNWIPEKLNPTPLKKVLELMNKKIEVDVIFRDIESVVMYKIKLKGFFFEHIHNLRNYDWNDNGIKELAVQYNFDEEQIIVN